MAPPKSHRRVCLAIDTVPDVKEKIFKFILSVPWIPPCAIQSPRTKSTTLDYAGQRNSLPSLNLCDFVKWATKYKRGAKIFWRADPCSTGFPPYVSVLGTHLYQCTSQRCCGRLCSAQWTFFWRFLQHLCPFYDGWFTSTPANTTLSVQQFLTKKGNYPLWPTLPTHLTSPRTSFFLFPQMKKVLKGKRFADVKVVTQKTAETLKGIKIDKFKNRFEQWKKHLDKCIASNGKYLKVTEV